MDRYEVKFITQTGVPAKTFITAKNKSAAREKFKKESNIPYVSITNICKYKKEYVYIHISDVMGW